MINKTNNKINIKARIDRHLRIVKDGVYTRKEKINSDKEQNIHIYAVFLIVLFLFPIYPSLSSFVYNNSALDFYRWDIDESTILESYYTWEWDDEESINSPIFESAWSFLSVNTILNDTRDLKWTNEIISYIVKPWDSFSTIAYWFWVSTSSIYWANDMTKSHVLRPWENIQIPPVSWLIHTVISGDTLSTISSKYEVEEEKILEQNLMTSSDTLKIWEILVIPWAIKKIVKPIITPVITSNKSNNTNTTTKSPTYSFVSSSSSQYTDNKWVYQLVRRQPYSWVAWNCTWYVAQYKWVNWRWNANQWMRNASAKWHNTWSNPVVGAIVQFSGKWYNPRYGHVGIVMEVNSDHIIVSDMNYRRLYEITYRKIPINDRSIDWYIYVN